MPQPQPLEAEQIHSQGEVLGVLPGIYPSANSAWGLIGDVGVGILQIQGDHTQDT